VPRKLNFQGKSIAQGDSLFSRGDAVVVNSGYNSQVNEIFSGFVSAIKPQTPMEFHCQDEMWQLKQTNINTRYKKVSLQQLLTDHCPIPFQALNENLGTFTIKHASLAQALEELEKSYGLYSWVRDGKLYSGLAVWPELQKTATFQFAKGGYPRLGDIIEDDLEYIKAEDVKIKVKAVSLLDRGSSAAKKIEIEVGDPGGEERTLHFYNLDQATLKKRAEAEIDKLKYTGYKGSFTTFALPHVKHGDIAHIVDENNMGREGRYLIKKVTYKSSMSGSRQKIELDRKIA
jgi:hypothetical protein